MDPFHRQTFRSKLKRRDTQRHIGMQCTVGSKEGKFKRLSNENELEHLCESKQLAYKL